jgi:hypothetical protein
MGSIVIGGNLTGARIDVEGYLAKLTVRDILNGAEVLAGGTANQKTTISAHDIGDGTTIDVASSIANLTAARVGGADFFAPSLGSLSTKGDKALGIPGDFAADVTLSGQGLATTGRTLGGATIKNQIIGGTWDVGGSAGAIAAGSTASAWKANFIGDVSGLTISGDLRGVLAARSFGAVVVKGNLDHTVLLAGADLGSDASLGGAGEAADTFGPGSILSLKVEGAAAGARSLLGAFGAADVSKGGIRVQPTSGLVTDEDGATASFQVWLTLQPEAPVVIDLATSDATEGRPSPPSLVFTPSNWNKAQTVTITGARGPLTHDVNYRIVFSPAVSNDLVYNGLQGPALEVVNRHLGDWTGDWTYPLFGFGDELNNLTWHLTFSGTRVTGTYVREVVDSLIDPSGTIYTGKLNGTISESTLSVLTDGGTRFTGTINGNTLSGTSSSDGHGGGNIGHFELHSVD